MSTRFWYWNVFKLFNKHVLFLWQKCAWSRVCSINHTQLLLHIPHFWFCYLDETSKIPISLVSLPNVLQADCVWLCVIDCYKLIIGISLQVSCKNCCSTNHYIKDKKKQQKHTFNQDRNGKHLTWNGQQADIPSARVRSAQNTKRICHCAFDLSSFNFCFVVVACLLKISNRHRIGGSYKMENVSVRFIVNKFKIEYVQGYAW